MSSERADHTLQATALVHEAYLRLVGDRRIPWQNSAHFYAAGDPVLSLTFSNDGRKLVSTSSSARFVTVWDLNRGESRQFPVEGRHVVAAMSPNNSLIAAISFGGHVTVLDLTGQTPVQSFDGPTATTQIAFLNERTLVTASHLDLVLVDLDNEDQRFNLSGHGGAVWYLGLSGDRRTIASGGLEGSVRLWRALKAP